MGGEGSVDKKQMLPTAGLEWTANEQEWQWLI